MHAAALSLLALVATAGDGDGFIQGMTVSCPGYGRVWGAPPMREALRELKGLGVRWVAIHPYAGVRRDGRIRWQPAAETGYLGRAMKIAAEEDVKLFYKPHLAYWGSFEWRGSIEFGRDGAAWRRFFDGYRAFIVDQARFAEAHDVPLFSVGVEYKKTLRFEGEWRRIIREVRAVYTGTVTYAANWDSVTRVPFWDAVDLIGVQAYFPLARGTSPSKADLVAAWDHHLAGLEALSLNYQRPVLFAEIGYARSTEAAMKPWAPEEDGSEAAVALRARLMEVALERVEASKAVRGMFWWKWLPGRSLFHGDFNMRNPEAKKLLREHWTEPD